MRRSIAPTLLALDTRPLGRAGAPMGDPGPPLCLAREIGIFVRVSDDDDVGGVVNRFVLAQRGRRVLDLGQRGGSRSPCGPQNIQPTSGNRISRKKAFCELRIDGVLGSSLRYSAMSSRTTSCR